MPDPGVAAARWLRAPGLRLEPLDEGWAAFSPASGETHLINDSGAALLQALSDASPMALEEALHTLAEEAGQPLAEVGGLFVQTLPTFAAAGLVMPAAPGTDTPVRP